MYKIRKDDLRPGRYRLQYFLVSDLLTPLYILENMEWVDIEKFIKGTGVDPDDMEWVHDLIRLLDKQINLRELGDWSVL